MQSFTPRSSKFTFHPSKCLRSPIHRVGLTHLLFECKKFTDAWRTSYSHVGLSLYIGLCVQFLLLSLATTRLSSSSSRRRCSTRERQTCKGTLCCRQMGYTRFAIAHIKLLAQNPPFICTQSSTGPSFSHSPSLSSTHVADDDVVLVSW